MNEIFENVLSGIIAVIFAIGIIYLIITSMM